MDIKKLRKLSNAFYEIAKLSQDVNSPEVKFVPVGKPEAACAIEILKLWNPSYFIGVSEILIKPSANYGYVETGPNKDPHVNYPRSKALGHPRSLP